MSPAAAKVFIVIAGHLDRHWTAHLSNMTLKALTGMGKQGVLNGIAWLETAGVLAVIRGGGRGHANTYTILINGLPRWTVSDGERVHAGGAKGSTPARETVHAGVRNGPRGWTPTERTENNRAATEAAAPPGAAAGAHAQDGQAGARVELAKANIDVQTIDRLLVELPGLNAAIVRTARGRVNGRAANPPGLLLHILRSDGPDLIRQAADRAKARASAQRRAAERNREREVTVDEAERERRERQSILADLAPDDLKRLVDRAIAEGSPLQAKEWAAHRDVTKGRGLAIAVARLARAELNAGRNGDGRGEVPR